MTEGGRSKQGLFACVANCSRRQMAEASARMFGGERVKAYSAGCRPLGRVRPKAVEAMRELGYDLTGHQSKSLADLPAVESDVAVTMGCGEIAPFLRAKVREDWNVPWPKRCPRRSAGRFVTSPARRSRR